MGITIKQKLTKETLLRALFVFASVPTTLPIFFTLPTLFFDWLSLDTSMSAFEVFIFLVVPIIFSLFLVFAKWKQPLWIILSYLVIVLISSLNIAGSQFPLLVIISAAIAGITAYAYLYFVKRFTSVQKLQVLVVIGVFYVLFVLMGNISMNLYILIGEWLRDITNWKLNIFYFDYQGFVVLFTCLSSSLSVFLVRTYQLILKQTS